MNLPPFSQTAISLTACALNRALSVVDAEFLSNNFAKNEPWLTLGVSAAGLKNYLLRDDASLYRYIVQVDRQTAGIICLRYPWLRGPYIELLGLTEPYRGLGIGTELLQWVEGEARMHHVNNVWLVASEFNQPALQFYQRHGFTIVGTLYGLVHPDYNELLLRKQL
jgi:diamine N-acetyltransferase